MVKTVMRRVRGALGVGALWAAGGALVGGVIEAVLNVLPGSDLFLGVDIWPAALAVPAFLAGISFAVVLGIVERRRTFNELRVPRLAVWGALGGVALAALVGLPAIAIATFGLTSSALAAGSLALARRAREPELSGAASGKNERLPNSRL